MGRKEQTKFKLLGNTFQSKYGEKFKVIDYVDNENVTLEYEDGTVVTSRSVNIRQGNPPNPNRRVIYGQGYHGVGVYPISNNGGKSLAYVKWHGMLSRVYDGNNDKTKLATACYDGVCVSEYWHNFQNFAEWFYREHGKYTCKDVLCLDKDLLGKGTKVYSKDTCCFLPYCLNIAIQVGYSVHYDARRRTFRPRVSMKGVTPYLGDFKHEDEAREAYFNAKNKHISSLAESYRGSIPDNVLQALLNFNTKEIYEQLQQNQ